MVTVLSGASWGAPGKAFWAQLVPGSIDNTEVQAVRLAVNIQQVWIPHIRAKMV